MGTNTPNDMSVMLAAEAHDNLLPEIKSKVVQWLGQKTPSLIS